MKDYDCCNYCLSLGVKDCCPCHNKDYLEDIIDDFVCDFYVPNYTKIVDESRADERAKVLDEVIKTLGNDYWSIAKIEQLKEQK